MAEINFTVGAKSTIWFRLIRRIPALVHVLPKSTRLMIFSVAGKKEYIDIKAFLWVQKKQKENPNGFYCSYTTNIL